MHDDVFTMLTDLLGLIKLERVNQNFIIEIIAKWHSE